MATKVHFHTADEMAQLLATIIAGTAGGTTGRWRKLIGRVEKLSTWNNVRCNWRVHPSGSAQEQRIIDQAAEVVRSEHPYVG